MEKGFSSKLSPRCLEGSCCKHAGNLRQENPQVTFSRCRKWKFCHKIYSFPKCSCWQVQCMFWQPCKKVRQDSSKSAKNREKTSIIFFIHQFFHKKFMRTLDRSFDKPVGTLEPKVRKTFACYPLSQIFHFISKLFFHKFFLTRADRFWSSCHKTLFAINHENFRLVSGNELFFFHRKFLMKFFPWLVKCSSDNFLEFFTSNS